MKRELIICEGCGRGVQKIQQGWIQSGASARAMPRMKLASWCPDCVKDGTMRLKSKPIRQVRAEYRQRLRAESSR